MAAMLDSDSTLEMQKIANELFGIIPGIEHASSVPVVQAERLTKKEFMHNNVAMNHPCLIKGAVKDWPASIKWRNKNYWIATCRNEPKRIIRHMNYFSWKRKAEGSEEVLFHDAMESLFAGKEHIFSIPGQVVTDESLFSGILKDVPGFHFLKREHPPLWDNPRVLYLYRRASTAWHVHYCDETLMCQVKGAKKVALLPAHIPCSKVVTSFLENELYLEGKALDKTLHLNPMVVVVEEGDALYIPPHWFHCVVPTDGEPGFTFIRGFRSPWHIYGNLSNYFVRRLYKRVMKNAPAAIKLALPFLCLYSMFCYYTRKLTG